MREVIWSKLNNNNNNNIVIIIIIITTTILLYKQLLNYFKLKGPSTHKESCVQGGAFEYKERNLTSRMLACTYVLNHPQLKQIH